jgi:hypothetical protein
VTAVREAARNGRATLAEGELIMLLIIWYLGLVAAGDVLAYFIGLFVEYDWGSNASMIIFLAIYFVTLWVAWVLAVWLTERKKAAVRQPF